MNTTKHDSETPAHGQQVITACAFITHDFDGVQKVFLARRASTKKFLPNVFELPGGHIEYGEDIEEGLKREVHEELKKDIELGDPFAVFTYVNEVKGSHSIEVVYFAKWHGGIDDITLNPEDHSEYVWFSEQEVKIHYKEISADGTDQDPECRSILKGFRKLTS